MVTPVAGPPPCPVVPATDLAQAPRRHTASADAAKAMARRGAPSFMGPSTDEPGERFPWEGTALGRAFLGLLRGLRSADEGRVDLVQHDALVDHALGDVLAGGQLVHDVQQDLFQDGPEAAGAGGA